jgi:hypothetical protein
MQGRSILLDLWIANLLAAALLAIGPTGSIVGTVSDPSGAVVPKARVTVRNQETNATRDVETNGFGDYTVSLLSPGRYRVSAEKTGFRRSVYSGVNLDVDQAERVDFSLQIGALNEEITVADAPPIIQTDTSTLGQVIDPRQMRELPLNERNFLSFALLVPGSQQPSEGSQNSTQGGAVSVNGAREQSNSFLLEGVDNNDPYINQYVALPSAEAIQEFKVQSGDYSAEFGRSGGAQINVILKSGANQFHGSAFEYFRNRNLDAKNFFDLPGCTPAAIPGTCGQIPRFDRNQFGGTLGGPVRTDKTFFFVSYEGLHLRQAATRQATVPSQVQRLAALAAVPAPYQNPAGLAVLNLLPAANVGSNLAFSNTFAASGIIRNSVNMPLVKMDHRAGPKDSLSAHYSFFDENRFNPFDPSNAFTSLPGYGDFALNRGQNAGVGWTHILGTRAVNELRLGFNRMRAGALQEHNGSDMNRQLGFPTVLTRPEDLGFPNVSLLGFDAIGEPVNYPQDRHDTTLHVADNLAWTHGRHQFKFGADVRRIQVNNYLDFLARGEWVFQGGRSGDPMVALVQLVSGVPDYALSVKGDTFNSLRSTGMSYYAQDDIRVAPRLLLNVGLRYEYNAPPVEAHDRFSVPDLSARSMACSPYPDCQFLRAGTNGIPRATYDKDLNNVAPRIGVAWRPLKTERFVVRSAYGIFYDVGIMNISIFPRANPPFYEINAFPNNNYGTLVIQNILGQQGLAVVQPNAIARNLRDAYMQQWNLDLQYEVRPNWLVDLAYVGSKGTHLTGPRDLNQARPDTGAVPYPQFSSLLFIESRSSSSYNSLQFRSEKRVTRGISFLAAYTFSKSIDDVSSVFSGDVGSGLPQDSQNLHSQRGLSDFHSSHRLAFSYAYELPFGAGRRWFHNAGLPTRLLTNWQLAGILAAQTGQPFTATRGTAQTQTSINAFGIPDRPDLLSDPFQPGPVSANPNPGCRLTQSQGGLAADLVRQPESWFNPCAFATPQPGRFGSAGRNILIGPGIRNLDVSLVKNMPFRTEGRRLQLRAEVFNLLNHPNFDIPNRLTGTPAFGRVLSANRFGNKPPRQLQLGFRYAF